MNPGIILITELILLMPLEIWIAVRMCNKEDQRLAFYASLVTLILQLCASILLRRDFTADPVLFALALMFCQAFIIFQMRLLRGMQERCPYLCTKHPVFSVILSALLYTVPWWLVVGWALKRLG